MVCQLQISPQISLVFFDSCQAVQEMKKIVSRQVEKRREKARRTEERLRKADEARATAHNSEDDSLASNSASAVRATDQSPSQTQQATARTVVDSSSSGSSSSRNEGIRGYFQAPASESPRSPASGRGRQRRAPRRLQPSKRKAPSPAKRKSRRAKPTGVPLC